MSVLSIYDLQALPESEPESEYDEFGLAKCTATCAESCAYTCGKLSCTHTVGVVAEQGVSDAAVLRAQAAMPPGTSSGFQSAPPAQG